MKKGENRYFEGSQTKHSGGILKAVVRVVPFFDKLTQLLSLQGMRPELSAFGSFSVPRMTILESIKLICVAFTRLQKHSLILYSPGNYGWTYRNWTLCNTIHSI